MGKNKTDNHIFSLNENYRSSKEMIEDLNNFYIANDVRKKFVEGVEYEEIEAKKDYNFYIETNEGNLKKGLLWVKLPNDENKKYTTVNSIYEKTRDFVDFLKTNCKINNTNILYKDIAILVRSKDDAKGIKDQLEQKNIPVRIASDISIMETEEAKELFSILNAMLYPFTSNINSALASSIIGYNNPTYLLSDDKETEMEKLNAIKQTWQEKGIFAAIFQLLREFGLFSRLYNEGQTIKIQRQITNIIHLAEILSFYELNNMATPQDLLLWFQKKIATGDKSEGYELQMESEEEAIQIITIHKSKGLEFPVVLLPRTNFMPTRNNKDSFFSFRYSGDGNNGIWVYTKGKDDKDYGGYYQKTENEENKRLFYVALTRSKYFTVIFYYLPRGGDKSIYKKLDLPDENTPMIDLEELLASKKEATTTRTKPPKSKIDIRGFKGDLSLKWIVTSYSALDTHIYTPATQIKSEKYENDYDHFIFNTLEKGAATGSILHKIMEEVDFENMYLTESQKLKFKTALQLKDNEITYIDNLVEHILGAEYTDKFGNSFSLTEVENNVFKELEFYFSFKDFDKPKIEELIKRYNYFVKIDEIATKGVVHGFVDLLFMYNGKYYILDWKSNYLGDNLEYYQNQHLEDAMQENNYHLQYLLYSIALKRHLGNNFKEWFGGVFYVFMRGTRKGKNIGIYYNYPELDLLDNLDILLGK